MTIVRPNWDDQSALLSTVITIAHRIEAVKDADYFVVLDQGRVARQGHVADM